MWPIYLKIRPNWPNRQCCLAGTSKTAPRILTFSIAMDVDNSFYVKSIVTYAPTFFGYIISVLAMVQELTALICMLWQLGWFVLEDEVSLRDPEDSIFLIATSSSNMRLALDFLAKELNFQYNTKCPYGVLEIQPRQIKNT